MADWAPLLEDLMRARSLMFGLGAGLLFFAHAMINNSHAWPLVWPFLAGVLAVWTSRTGGHATYGADVGRAAKVGIIAGMVFILTTAFTLDQLGLSEGAGLVGLIFAAAIGLLGAMLGGALVHPLARRA
jgi:hypothetical protein